MILLQACFVLLFTELYHEDNVPDKWFLEQIQYGNTMLNDDNLDQVLQLVEKCGSLSLCFSNETCGCDVFIENVSFCFCSWFPLKNQYPMTSCLETYHWKHQPSLLSFAVYSLYILKCILLGLMYLFT